MTEGIKAQWAVSEMAGARLSDERCRPNLVQICDSLFRGNDKSWSAALGSRLRQAAYNIIKSSKTTVAGLLAGHVKQTVARSQELPIVLVAQDTTDFDYSGHSSKSELGYLKFAASRGLCAHGVLAMRPCGAPLGVLGVSFWTRDRASYGQKVHHNHRPIADKESRKWIDGLLCAEAAYAPDQPILLIQDREADIFAFLAMSRRPTTHLLIRACRPRCVEVEGQQKLKLFDAVAAAPILGHFRIKVPRRPNQEGRLANLSLQVQEMTALPPANQLEGEPDQPQKIWAIQTNEIDPPDGVAAIGWTLISTLPVNNLEEGKQMVEYYTRRWTIERLHYTLKSGLHAEQLQIDNQHRLENALAILYIVAWQVMWLTYAARTEPNTLSTDVLSDIEVTVLKQMSKKDVTHVYTAIIEIAKMGGYEPYRNGPPPGVKSIWTGLRTLQTMVETWREAMLYQQRNVTHA